jgi:phosphonate transport system substrate-binding protein
MYDDARDKFKDTMPEIFQETKVIGKTDPIPSDTVAVARDLPPEIVAKIVQALMEIVSDEQTKHVLYDLYDIEGLVPAKDSDYDSVREMANVLDLDLEKEVGKG